MSISSDVDGLYRYFGGQPGQYRSMSSDRAIDDALARWPMLQALRGTEASARPDAAGQRVPEAPATADAKREPAVRDAAPSQLSEVFGRLADGGGAR